MTLLEVILVLAIMIVIGAIVTPRLQKSLARQRVKNSGEMIRALFNEARVEAMKSGKIQLFRCELETRNCTISVWESADDGSTRDAVIAGDPTAAAAAIAPIETPETTTSSKTKKLPEGVHFVLSESLASKRSAAVEEEVFGGGTMEEASQSAPILFYPDGSSSHAQVIVADEKENAVIVKVRGMTGLATIGDIKPLDDLMGK